MTRGTIKWFNGSKGFGFISPAGGGADVFVHRSAIRDYGHHGVPENQAVEFELSEGSNGPQAMSVRIL